MCPTGRASQTAPTSPGLTPQARRLLLGMTIVLLLLQAGLTLLLLHRYRGPTPAAPNPTDGSHSVSLQTPGEASTLSPKLQLLLLTKSPMTDLSQHALRRLSQVPVTAAKAYPNG